MCHPARGRVRGNNRLCVECKRLGEDKLFSGAFVVFRHISVNFRVFCLEVLRKFVYLQSTKGVMPLGVKWARTWHQS